MPRKGSDTAARKRLAAVVKHRYAPALVDAYFASSLSHIGSAPEYLRMSEPGFAGATFLDLKPNHPHSIDQSDLLAVSLLDVALGPSAVRKLLWDDSFRSDVTNLLMNIPQRQPLWRIKSLASAHDLWHLLKQLPQVGKVKAGKLLARKRPHLIPIVDSVVERVVDAPSGEYWSTFRDFLQEPDAIQWVRDLRPERAAKHLPCLRILDAAIWMLGSNGKSVRRVRHEVVGNYEPLL